LTIRERVLGPHHPKTKKTQERASSLLRDLGGHDKAISDSEEQQSGNVR